MSLSAKAPEPSPTRRPIGTVRISTVALLGIAVVVAIPVGAAALVMTDSIDSKHTRVPISETRRVSKVVVDVSDGSVSVTGDPTMSGVSGTADLNWHGFTAAPLRLDSTVTDGVLTLKQVCLRGGCGGADVHVRVPPGLVVQARTTNAGIDVHNVDGGVDLQSTNGPIIVDGLGSGDALLRTTNGGIDAKFTGAPMKITANTTNGPVDITTDGKTLYYDQVSNTNGPRDLENDYRYADHEIDVNTTNGGVTVR